MFQRRAHAPLTLRPGESQAETTTLTVRACGPFGLSSTSYSTFAPSARLLYPSPLIALWWTKTSLPQSSCVYTSLDCVTNVQRKAQKPKPVLALTRVVTETVPPKTPTRREVNGLVRPGARPKAVHRLCARAFVLSGRRPFWLSQMSRKAT